MRKTAAYSHKGSITYHPKNISGLKAYDMTAAVLEVIKVGKGGSEMIILKAEIIKM